MIREILNEKSVEATRPPKQQSVAVLDSLLRAKERLDAKAIDDLVNTIQVLLVGGVETTSNSIAMAVIHASSHLQQWRRLALDDEYLDAFIEETLRYYTIFDVGLTRAANSDIELSCGSIIRAGDGVIVSLTAANRDPGEMDDADKFDPERPRCPHVAFGHGPHFCIGHNLARETMRSALRGLSRHFPVVRLAEPLASLDFTHGQAIFGPATLPVLWSKT
ncbi:hypothetical protein ATY76_22435 [Rhizobium sp. R339]|nr:hypothetical protein ATY76_22435 [Rhizobium sp. R339]